MLVVVAVLAEQLPVVVESVAVAQVSSVAMVVTVHPIPVAAVVQREAAVESMTAALAARVL